MDISRFLSSAPGRLVKLSEEDTAFVPAPLPPQGWALPERLWPKLAQAKQEIGLLEGIGRSLPNSEVLLRPLQNREAIRSSSLEGTYATPEQLLLLELDTEKTDGGATSAVREVAN
jgi:Fic family protein